MVRKISALSEVTSLQKDIHKLFEHLGQIDTAEVGVGPGEWFPRVDVFETADRVVVKVDAPGFSAEDLEVVFKGQKMILTGEKKQSRVEESVLGYLCLERSFGKFQRALYIDEAVDFTRAEAKLTDGVLKITIPKLEDRRGGEFRLSVQEAKSS